MKNHLSEVKHLYFKDSPIVIDESLSGQRVRSNILYLGLKAGPDSHISYLLHEMSHFAEIDDARILESGWGFKYGAFSQIIMGREYREFSSTQATEREIRVWAFQQSLQESLGIKSPIKELVSVAIHLGDWANVAFGDKLGLKSEKKALSWVEAQVKDRMKTFNLDAFQSEWTRKNSLLININKF
jgi:hypothetical protein